MESFSLFSNHITIAGTQHPVSGVIEVTGEFISKVHVLGQNCQISFESIQGSFENLIDYSEFFISPGLIDLNARVEWENMQEFSKSAISGGVTFTLIEPSLYNSCAFNYDELYCDVGHLKTVDDWGLEEDLDSYFAVKAYLFQPSARGKSIKNVNLLRKIQADFNRCIFVDPNLPEQRLMMLNSPNRYKDNLDHAKNEIDLKLNIWADAYEEGSDSDSSSSELPLPKRTVSLLEVVPGIIAEDLLITPNLHSKGGDEIITTAEKLESSESSPIRLHHSNYHFHVHSSTLFDDINKKVSLHASRKQSLLAAEQNSYKFLYPSVSSFASTEPDSPLIPLSQPTGTGTGTTTSTSTLSLSTSPLKFKPQLKVSTSFNQSDKFQDYTSYLANSPESWELRGISKVLSSLSQSSKIHFQGISSASAINQIRRSSETFKHISCELPASHLFFSASSIQAGDTRFKSHPVIRDKDNLDLTWDLVKLNAVQVISSNHSRISDEFKAKTSGNFLNALPGIEAVGFALQSVWTYEHCYHPIRSIGTLLRIFKWMALQPAKILGLKKRGNILKGNFADLIVWRPLEEDCRDRKGVYKGEKLYGRVVKVFLRGKVAFDKGECFGAGRRRCPADEV